MSESDLTGTPSAPPTIPASGPLPSHFTAKPFSWWMRKLFYCNPFYLVSAALLLYGCYRISIDSPFSDQESTHLVFNFTAVQLYELLLAGTAIFLVRRTIWYDATLLFNLENLFVFVPFILISQAALMDSGLGLELCLAGAAIAIARFAGFKRHFKQLNLPPRMLGFGAVFLALNASLPVIYRHFGQTKIGLRDSGAAYWMNECTWLLILPAVLGLASLLPRARATGDLPPQNRWLPLGLYLYWLAVTVAHVYGLDYVYQFNLRGELLAPATWVLAWTLFQRVQAGPLVVKYALTCLPLFAPALSTSPGGRKTFLILAGLNLVIYTTMALRNRDNRLARHLIVWAVLVIIGGLPPAWLHLISLRFDNLTCFEGGLMSYLLYLTKFSRNPRVGFLGAIIFGYAILWTFHGLAGIGYWALQGAVVYLLLHSLRWNDQEHTGANFTRITMSLVWLIQSLFWMNSEYGLYWMPFIPGAIVLGVCLASQLHRLEWKKIVVPVTAVLVTVSGPCCEALHFITSVPIGLLATISSFILFGLGTVAALIRHHWPKHESHPASGGASVSPAKN